MNKLTVGQIIDGHTVPPSPRLYVVVRHGVKPDIIYVGQSYDPVVRIQSHIYDLSHLGRAINDNLPYSKYWVVYLLTPSEAMQFGGENDLDVLPLNIVKSDIVTVDMAENRLISFLLPRLNISGNPRHDKPKSEKDECLFDVSVYDASAHVSNKRLESAKMLADAELILASAEKRARDIIKRAKSEALVIAKNNQKHIESQIESDEQLGAWQESANECVNVPELDKFVRSVFDNNEPSGRRYWANKTEGRIKKDYWSRCIIEPLLVVGALMKPKRNGQPYYKVNLSSEEVFSRLDRLESLKKIPIKYDEN